jgi:hypothetical protein
MSSAAKHSPILVTGAHRSGTTWIGKMLSIPEGVQYLYESFHPNGLLRRAKLFPIWFRKLELSETDPYVYHLDRIFKYKYSLKETFSIMNNRGQIDLKNIGPRINFYIAAKKNIFKGEPFPVPLLKDPIALFSAEWLFHKFNTRNVIIIRHPAAFVYSLKRLNWRFNFQSFLQQSNLMQTYLNGFKDDLRSSPDDPIEESALLWNCLYHVVADYRKRYPDWIYVRHEDTSRSPIESFKAMYSSLNIRYDQSVLRKIEQHSSFNTSGPKLSEKRIHRLKRDSSGIIKVWKTKLSTDEIDRIYNITKPVSSLFYSDNDW